MSEEQVTQRANIILDASKIDLFETCPCRYDYRHNHNKTVGVESKNKSLDLGSLAHEGLQVYYEGLRDQIQFKDRISALTEKINTQAADPEISNSEPEEVNHLISCVVSSLDYWRAEDENCLEILEVEKAFLKLIYEDEYVRIFLSGKIDLLVNFNGIGRQPSYKRLPIDHKTYSKDSILNKKSNQFINYADTVESNYLIVNRIGLQKTIAPEEKFKRLPLSYDPLYISEWKKNLIQMLTIEFLGAISSDYWSEKPTSCNKFNRLCEYYDVCNSSATREEKLVKLYRNYSDAPEWDVTKGLRDD